MSSEDVAQKDEGISDVISLLQNVDVSKETSESSKVQQNGHDEDENVRKQPPVVPGNRGNSSKSKQSREPVQPPGDNPNQEMGDAGIDLANPDQVLHMLETVDLTEEDTESLLQEAYNMNKKLKEILRRQQNTNEPSVSKSAKKRSKQAGDSHSTSVSSTSTNSRMGSASLKKAPLPPIEKEQSIYAVKLQRSRTTVADVKQIPRQTIPQRSKSTQQAKETNGHTRKSKVKSTDPKPEWNDRFNYS